MDYDLTRLSTRSFEQLIQALALAVLGPGVTVFGDGPDGGREATFDGRVPFPSDDAPWDGFGVIQAKFRQRPRGGGGDADWVLGEIKAELDKFIDPERKLRRPEYYLFATNVVLTPVAGAGGKDRVAALFEDYRDRLALKGWHVWDHDQLCALLDTQVAIRTAYSAWITAGDVLAHLRAQLQPRNQDFRAIMVNFLQKELIAEQYVTLARPATTPRGQFRWRGYSSTFRSGTEMPDRSTTGPDPWRRNGGTNPPGLPNCSYSAGSAWTLPPTRL